MAPPVPTLRRERLLWKAGASRVAGVDEVGVAGKRLALAVPTTYMNDSGQAVAPLVRRYGVEPEHLVIVHDELDLEPAVLRVKVGGGLAGRDDRQSG